jgi:alpha-beta hydrolase superfamily lysophospholipase
MLIAKDSSIFVHMNARILIPSLILLLSACAFNGRFHRPDKIPFDAYVFPSYDLGGDTTFIDYDSISHEITLRDNRLDTINSAYTITSFVFRSESGNLLNGWKMTPKDQDPLATIVHFHGTSQNILAQYQSIEPLLKFGFEVYTFDYSGYGFSEGEATRKNALSDAYSGLSYAQKELEGQDREVVLYGHSYGGYLAAIVGSNKQDSIDGIVIEGAFSSHKDEAKYEVPFWGNLVKNEAIATKEIGKNTHPVLIIHSKDDRKVPVEFGKQIFESANAPKEYFEIEKSHCMGLAYYPDQIAKKILEMLEVE